MKFTMLLNELEKLSTPNPVIFVSCPPFPKHVLRMWSEASIRNVSRMSHSVVMKSDPSHQSENMKMYEPVDSGFWGGIPERILILTVPEASDLGRLPLGEDALVNLARENDCVQLFSDPNLRDENRMWMQSDDVGSLGIPDVVIMLRGTARISVLRKTLMDEAFGVFWDRMVTRIDDASFRLAHKDCNNVMLNVLKNRNRAEQVELVLAGGKKKVNDHERISVECSSFEFENYSKRVAEISEIHHTGIQSITESLKLAIKRNNPSLIPSHVVKMIEHSDLVLGSEVNNLKAANVVVYVTSKAANHQIDDELHFTRAICLKNRIFFRMIHIEDLEDNLHSDAV